MRAPREQILQKMVYDRYMRPHLHMAEILADECMLISDLGRQFPELSVDDRVALVQRWMDKAWHKAARDYTEFRQQNAQLRDIMSECDAPLVGPQLELLSS